MAGTQAGESTRSHPGSVWETQGNKEETCAGEPRGQWASLIRLRVGETGRTPGKKCTAQGVALLGKHQVDVQTLGEKGTL